MRNNLASFSKVLHGQSAFLLSTLALDARAESLLNTNSQERDADCVPRAVLDLPRARRTLALRLPARCPRPFLGLPGVERLAWSRTAERDGPRPLLQRRSAIWPNSCRVRRSAVSREQPVGSELTYSFRDLRYCKRKQVTTSSCCELCLSKLVANPCPPVLSSTRSFASSSQSIPRPGATTAGAASLAPGRAARASASTRWVAIGSPSAHLVPAADSPVAPLPAHRTSSSRPRRSTCSSLRPSSPSSARRASRSWTCRSELHGQSGCAMAMTNLFDLPRCTRQPSRRNDPDLSLAEDEGEPCAGRTS